jgi:uncharacterized protein with HEPN domain
MRPDEADAAYLLDMYEACQEALIFIEGVSVQQFLSDPLVRRGVERDLEIAGEAARRVSGAFQGAHPEVPWREIIGQRNVLAHDLRRCRAGPTLGDTQAGLAGACRHPEEAPSLDHRSIKKVLRNSCFGHRL